ncbi:hypothetical protein B0H13DRAFT_1915249 [Mycena leptocephala]|nr:hypothetical protein B0H13DRAFT_1915249 [Mycena leptocephala]
MAKYRERRGREKPNSYAMVPCNDEGQPEAYSEQQKQAKKARAKYEERHACKAKQLLKRDEASYKALGKERYYAVAAKKKEGARDYDMEWLVYQEERREKDIRQQVFGLICQSKLMSSPTSSSWYYCLPPFHDEPQGCQEVIRKTVSCYLVTSPAAKEARGVYAEWTNAQRVSEAISHGGAPKYSCYNDTIPAWHACCDAGEHAHAKKPFAPAPIALIVPTALSPTTPSRTRAVPQTPAPSRPLCTTTASRALVPPRTLPHIGPTLPICYAVGGGGAVRTSLSEALQDLEAVAATGSARLITTQDTRYAAHIAAGHTEGQARALADGERLAEGLISWTVGNPISGPAGARRQTHAVCISELRAALSAIELSAAELDGEEVEEGPHRVEPVEAALNSYQVEDRGSSGTSPFLKQRLTDHGNGGSRLVGLNGPSEPWKQWKRSWLSVTWWENSTLFATHSSTTTTFSPAFLYFPRAAASQPAHSTRSSTTAKPSTSQAGKGHKAATLLAKPVSKDIGKKAEVEDVQEEEEEEESEKEEEEDSEKDELEYEKEQSPLPKTSKPQTPEDPTRKSPPEDPPHQSPMPEDSTRKSCAPEDPSHQLPVPEDPTRMLRAPEDPPHQLSEPQEPPHQSPAHEDQVPKPPTPVTHPAKSPLPRSPSPLSFPPPPPPAKLPVRQDPLPPSPPLPPPPAKSPVRQDPPPPSPPLPPPPAKSPAPEKPPQKSPVPEDPSQQSAAPKSLPQKSPPPPKLPPHPKSPLPQKLPPPQNSLPPQKLSPPQNWSTAQNLPPPQKSPTPSRSPFPPLPPPVVGEADASTHRERCPDVPQQPACKDKGKGKAGTAVGNTLTLKKKEKKDALAALRTEVSKWHAEVEKKVEEFAARHRLPEDEVRDIMLFSSRLKPSQGYHEFNAKVWRRNAELNEGNFLVICLPFILTQFVGKGCGERLVLEEVREFVRNEAPDAWSPEELVRLKIDYEEYKAAKELGMRPSNSACAADATSTSKKLFQELILLEKRTGACGFLIITKGHVNDSIRPQILGTPANCKFIPEILKMPVDSLPLKYERWATADEDEKPAKGQNKRGEIVNMIKAGLNAMFGTPDQNMEYKKYRGVIQAGMRPLIVGWPEVKRKAVEVEEGEGEEVERPKKKAAFGKRCTVQESEEEEKEEPPKRSTPHLYGRQNGSMELGSAEFGTLCRWAKLNTWSSAMNYSKCSVFLAKLLTHCSHFLIGHTQGSLGSVARGELVNFTGLDRLDHRDSKGVDEETKAVAGGEAMSIWDVKALLSQ